MRVTILAAAVVAVWAVGCETGPPYYGTVAGRVTLNGQPVPSGAIDFKPIDGNSPTASCMIKDGTYTARVPVNKHKVLISSPQPRGAAAKPGGDVVTTATVQVDETIPAKYNTKSELTAEVIRGPNTLNFDLVKP